MNFDLKRITLGNILSMTTVLGVAFVIYGDMQVMKNDIAWIKHSMAQKFQNIASSK